MEAKYGFFLGCVAPLRYPGIEKATRTVFKELGVELVDLEGAACCPAPGVVRSFDEATWLALGARNLAIAEKQGVQIMTICNGCYGSLFDVAHMLHEHPEKLKAVNEILKEVGLHYSGNTQVRHFAEVLYNEIGIEKIKSKVKNPLPAMNVAAHYGCHFLRPSKLKHLDDPERPHILDELIEWTGAKSLNYKDKQMCCGSGGGVRSRNSALASEFTAEKLKNMKAAGAQYIIDVCPFCHLQFDRTQHDTVKGYDIPVIHLAQLYGLAFGMPKNELGLEAHAVKVNL
ncbi:MAG: CoB--CoM heterodisulfide reductase subunit B [Methanomassiliicoccales archaeon PtaU1.Bin124]|nr:MAG: CoB--CoM heterodisulfide reductase subunit B [Methanomassiliicoccales archaeon PtaU1.Bin124]